jgi:hypothetical protein
MKINLKRGIGCLALASAVSLAIADSTVLNATETNRLLQTSQNANDHDEFLSTFNASGNMQNSVIEFDLSGLAGDTITSATLRLFGRSFNDSTSASSVSLYRITQPWSETTSTWKLASTGNSWNNLGGDAVGTTGVQMTDPYAVWTGNQTSTGTWYTWDVTDLVGLMAQGTVANNGFLLTAPVGNELSWVSRLGLGAGELQLPATDVPELDITYTTSAPEPMGMLALVGSVLLLAGRRKRRS